MMNKKLIVILCLCAVMVLVIYSLTTSQVRKDETKTILDRLDEIKSRIDAIEQGRAKDKTDINHLIQNTAIITPISNEKKKRCVETEIIPAHYHTSFYPSSEKRNDVAMLAAIEKLRDKKGFEIGGASPSSFEHHYQVYKIVGNVDNTNFGKNTIWTGALQDGGPFTYLQGKAPGVQYLRDATDLHDIPDEKYDFVLASHALEHIANPLKAVSEWVRVLKTGGSLLLILPDPRFTFDNRRRYVTFEHFLDSWKNNTLEDDMTHYDEIVELHNIPLDQGVSSKEQFAERSRHNFENRALHQHIYNFSLLHQIYDCFNVQPVAFDWWPPFNMAIIGTKLSN